MLHSPPTYDSTRISLRPNILARPHNYLTNTSLSRSTLRHPFPYPMDHPHYVTTAYHQSSATTRITLPHSVTIQLSHRTHQHDSHALCHYILALHHLTHSHNYPYGSLITSLPAHASPFSTNTHSVTIQHDTRALRHSFPYPYGSHSLSHYTTTPQIQLASHFLSQSPSNSHS